MTSKVSVIIPVYNVENYLSECLDSVLNQTLEQIEILCINDGSTDSSAGILEKYQKQDSRLSVLNRANSGYGSACNAGLRLAKGEYISIIEPDDFIDCKMFEDLYNLASTNEVDIIKSAFYEYDENIASASDCAKKIYWSQNYEMPESVFKIQDFPQFVYFHPSIWSCLYKREFLNNYKISFVEAKGAGWVDNPFQIQTLCLAKRIYYTDNAYYYYRLSNPYSSSNRLNICNPFDRSNEIHLFLDENNINNEDFLANLYKRELGYIGIVLGGVNADLFNYALKKITEMISRMDESIINKNSNITDEERKFYSMCKTGVGISEMMLIFKQKNHNIEIFASL